METIVIIALSIICVILMVKNYILKKLIKKALESTDIALGAAMNWKKASDNYKNLYEIKLEQFKKMANANTELLSTLESKLSIDDNNENEAKPIKLDDVLDKIKSVGFESLTDIEKQFLNKL